MEIKLNRYIEITSNVRSGKPCIAGQRITVTDIAIEAKDSTVNLRDTGHFPPTPS
jgi:uncharacterized protein (DUF433 family)